MSSQSEKFKIGLFVIVSVLLGVSFVIWLGASRWFQVSNKVVAYFTESVQGLETGSPVKFRGVSVGRVYDISMAPDAQHIEVVMSLNSTFKTRGDLGVKMNLLGITGQKYLEMERFEENVRKPKPDLNFEPPYPVITTYPSDIQEFGNALDNLFQKVKAVDLERVSENLVRVTSKLDKLLSDPKIQSLPTEISDTVNEFKRAARRMDNEVKRLQFSKRMGKTLDNTEELIGEGARTVRSADRFIRRTDNNLNRLAQKLEKSADKLDEFLRMIKNKPSTIVFGAPKRDKD
jgi:phospholipid/cholesterol/gamma-HCH transport system substrate-binding protein